jgi:hypothetical protein
MTLKANEIRLNRTRDSGYVDHAILQSSDDFLDAPQDEHVFAFLVGVHLQLQVLPCALHLRVTGTYHGNTQISRHILVVPPKKSKRKKKMSKSMKKNFDMITLKFWQKCLSTNPSFKKKKSSEKLLKTGWNTTRYFNLYFLLD